jgi:hypothetical protein
MSTHLVTVIDARHARIGKEKARSDLRKKGGKKGPAKGLRERGCTEEVVVPGSLYYLGNSRVLLDNCKEATRVVAVEKIQLAKLNGPRHGRAGLAKPTSCGEGKDVARIICVSTPRQFFPKSLNRTKIGGVDVDRVAISVDKGKEGPNLDGKERDAILEGVVAGKWCLPRSTPPTDRPEKAKVVHGAILLVALQPGGGLVKVLAEHEGVASLVLDRLANHTKVLFIVGGGRTFA